LLDMTAGNDLASAASELRIVLGQLIRRLRNDNALPASHLTVLSRLERMGTQTTSGLATAAYMRPQSMAQTVTELESEGLITRHPDPIDRRQILIELTQAGQTLLNEERRRREDWLSKTIADELTQTEQRQLLHAVDLLRRLAEL
jgi:DNA-binding MarR family transcriptional regulator